MKIPSLCFRTFFIAVLVPWLAVVLSAADRETLAGGSSAPKSPAPGVMAWVDPDREQPPLTHFETFRSGVIGEDVSYVVYLPPGYAGNEATKFPVLYWLHGTGGSPGRGGEVVAQIDAAIRDGVAPPMIVVLVNGLRGATMYADTVDGRWPLESVIVRDLIPHIDASYRTLATRESRAIEGFSMGGYGAAYLGFKYPELFGTISMLAPALIGPGLAGTPGQRWPAHFAFVFSNDMAVYEANNPYALAARNADRLRGRTLIRIVPHDEREHWFIARADELHQVLDAHGVANDFDARRDVTKHNFGLIYASLGEKAFGFYQEAFGRSASVGVGAPVSAMKPPRPLVTPPPDYPAELTDTGLSGTAIVTLTVKADGSVAEPVLKSADHAAFGQAAMKVIGAWTFAPAMRDGQPVDLRLNLPLRFNPPFEQQVNAALQRKVFRPITEPVLAEKQLGRKLKVKEEARVVYPPALARSGKTAKVEVAFVVAPDGTTLNPVAVGEPPMDFVASAISTVARTSFEPPVKQGKPVYVTGSMIVAFDEAATQGKPAGRERDPAMMARRREERGGGGGERQRPAGGEERFRMQFDRMDTNHDGEIAGEELSGGRGPQILARFDVNQDGKVTWAEVSGSQQEPAKAPAPVAAADIEPEEGALPEPTAPAVVKAVDGRELFAMKSFSSKALGGAMSYAVYLPPSYATEPERRFPVVFWCHGGGGGPGDIWRFSALVDESIRAGKCPEFIIIGINGRAGRLGSQYSDWKDGSLNAESAIIQDLLPHVDATYRTWGTREGRALEGFSMGGHGALHLAFKHPELFCAVTGLGPALIMPDSGVKNVDRVYREGAYGGDETYWRQHDPLTLAEQHADALRGKLRIRLISGEKEGNFTFNRTLELSAKLTELGIANTYVRPGETGHNYAKYYDAMPDAAMYYNDVFGAEPTSDPVPPVCYDLSKKFPREVGNYRVAREAEPVEPFEIMDGLYYVGNTQVGAHLLKTDNGLVLFDTPMPHEVPWLLESILKLGFRPADVKVVVGNHAHVDHIGGHWYFQHYFGAQTWLHEAEAAETEQGAWRPGKLVPLDGSVSTLAAAYPPFKTDRLLRDGETVEWGGRKITFRSAPGHTPGTLMITFPLQGTDGKTYLAGMLGGMAPGQPEFTATCQRLRSLPVEIFLGAHPNQNGTLVKAERLREGAKPNPFIDPAGWTRFLDRLIARGAGREGAR